MLVIETIVYIMKVNAKKGVMITLVRHTTLIIFSLICYIKHKFSSIHLMEILIIFIVLFWLTWQNNYYVPTYMNIYYKIVCNTWATKSNEGTTFGKIRLNSLIVSFQIDRSIPTLF